MEEAAGACAAAASSGETVAASEVPEEGRLKRFCSSSASVVLPEISSSISSWVREASSSDVCAAVAPVAVVSEDWTGAAGAEAVSAVLPAASSEQPVRSTVAPRASAVRETRVFRECLFISKPRGKIIF